MKKNNFIYKILLMEIALAFSCQLTQASSSSFFAFGDTTEEAKYYQIITVPIPKNVVLEVGGLAFTDKDQLGVSTRRGEVWLLDNPYSRKPSYKRYAHGLHEALGLAWKDKGFYLTQRGELTRLEDKNGDGKADVYKTIYSWPLSGNYHDYSYGPKFTKDGDMLVTLNLSWIGYGESLSKWRGWLLKITPEGEMTPIATGLRSPSGFNLNADGDVFYTENQGDWVGSGRMTHLEAGDFAGNPGGLRWSGDPESPLKLKHSEVARESGMTMYEYAKIVPELKPPAVWFPHTILGISTSDILIDDRGGKFGPFEGQMLVGDQGHSKIMRVYMEKVNGVYQGAAFPFREGFSSGILRMIWGSDNSMFVGMTSRGWASTGGGMYGLQRLKWTGKMPFEMKTIKAEDDGFIVEFTKPVDKVTAANPASYKMTSFTYKYHYRYGSPIIDNQKCMIHKIDVAEDGLSAKLTVHGMRLGFIHQLEAPGVKAKDGSSLLHDTGYYTLNQVPGGELKSPQMAGQMKSSGKEIVQAKRVNKIPESWVDGPETTLTVGTLPGLKFDIAELEVKAGSKVQLVFENNDDMLHNFVITKPGDAIDKVSKMAEGLGLDGADLNYVPDTDLVLFHTGIIQPESTESIFFEAPTEPGEYRFVCTFPGHSYVMRGKFIVK
ncbi:plastocyanin/azurin family copper-binding protein [Flexithrix dorotheae]|uniref:plastocyanin/azurin family copper-binding protein n=1 Tax=Flexithrix dorotheae TaxID=70993 RepID=UPI001FE11F15|nr:plastocyanin/azurin family copper-binding protein [Flexithrix dorotheae]